MHKKNLKFRLSGNELSQKSYNIDYMIKGLICSQRVIEQAYLTLIDRVNFTESDRKNMKIYAENIREGSFESDLIILIRDINLSLFPVIANSSAKEVWDLAKNSYDYLKAIFLANKKGEPIVVNITDSQGVSIVQNNEGTIITAGHNVYDCAKKSYYHLEQFSKYVDHQKGLEGFSLSDCEDKNKTMEITEFEREIFRNDPVLEEKEIVFKGIYVNAAVSSFSGRIEVIDSLESELQDRFYNFEFMDKRNESLFREGYVRARRYVALKRVQYDIEALKRNVVGLKILRVFES